MIYEHIHNNSGYSCNRGISNRNSGYRSVQGFAVINKYKAWDTYENKWVADDVYVGAKGLVFDCEGKELITPADEDRFIPVKFTGLKDFRSVEIYEGHNLYTKDGGHVGYVEFRDGSFRINNGISTHESTVINQSRASRLTVSKFPDFELLEASK